MRMISVARMNLSHTSSEIEGFGETMKGRRSSGDENEAARSEKRRAKRNSRVGSRRSARHSRAAGGLTRTKRARNGSSATGFAAAHDAAAAIKR